MSKNKKKVSKHRLRKEFAINDISTGKFIQQDSKELWGLIPCLFPSKKLAKVMLKFYLSLNDEGIAVKDNIFQILPIYTYSKK